METDSADRRTPNPQWGPCWPLEREVSASPAEFARGLGLAFPGAVEGGPTVFAVRGADASMEIRVTPGPDRVIALLRLPTLKMKIRFTSGDPEARALMLARMDLAMHRGGG